MFVLLSEYRKLLRVFTKLTHAKKTIRNTFPGQSIDYKQNKKMTKIRIEVDIYVFYIEKVIEFDFDTILSEETLKNV